MVLSSNNLNFDMVPVGICKTLDLMVKNAGDAVLKFEIESLEATPFTCSVSSCSIKPGDGTTLTFSFLPLLDTEYIKMLSLKNEKVILKGLGAEIKCKVPEELECGDVFLEEPCEVFLEIENLCPHSYSLQITTYSDIFVYHRQVLIKEQ
jgi:hypothetical protein